MSRAETELQEVRRACAQRTLVGATVVDERLESAFANVRPARTFFHRGHGRYCSSETVLIATRQTAIPFICIPMTW